GKLEIWVAMTDRRDDLLGRFASTEELSESSMDLAIYEEPLPHLLDAHISHVVLAQKLEHRVGTVQVLIDADRPKELLLNRHRCMSVVHAPLSSVREHDRLDTSGGGVRDELDGPLRVGEVGPEILGLEEQARRSQQQGRSAAFVFSSPN